MEHAPLRPVPSRRAGPVDPATAARAAAAALPWLDPETARALGLVALADRPRGEVATTLGLDAEELAAMLAAGRKELRRTVIALGGSGWCERAELYISDRLDGALAAREARRLDAHLRNCPRCVEHERRLVQATDALAWGLEPAAPRPAAAPPASEPSRAPATAQRDATLEAPEVELVETGPGELEPLETEPLEFEPSDPDPVELELVEVQPAEAEPVEPETVEFEPVDPEPVEPDSPPPRAPPARELAPTETQIAAAAEVLVARRTRRQIAAAAAWTALIAVAVILVLAAVAVSVAGVMGAEL